MIRAIGAALITAAFFTILGITWVLVTLHLADDPFLEDDEGRY